MNQNIFLPDGLKAIRNWCAWRLENRNGKDTKVPYICPGKKAASNDRNTWSSFDTITEVLEATSGYFNGYGFMISDGIVFIDIDHCISDNGTIDERGKDVISAFPLSYAEISQSGTGIHILTRGTLQRGFNNRKMGIEMYSSGRFCAITGNAIQANEPTEEQDGITYCFNKYSTHSPIKTSSQICADSVFPCSRPDNWIIRHASAVIGQRGRNFQTLYSGDTSAYESSSEADQALCTLLAFWCDCNKSQIDRIFRTSGLYRPKWEREDYRNRTIDHACNHIPETLSDYQQRMTRERANAIANER